MENGRMLTASPDETRFRLSQMTKHPLRRKVLTLLGGPIEKLLYVDRINAIYRELTAQADDRDFLTRALERLGITYEVDPEELARIPAEGPLVVMANHPFGLIEGMILADAVRKVRPDIKVMANSLLGLMPETRSYLIEVDPFGTTDSAAANRTPLRSALRWLRAGHALGTFPAGEVAHLRLRQRAIVDPPWSPMVAKLAQMAEAAAVPVHFAGANGVMFHLAGLVHPRVRTLLLPKEIINKANRKILVRIGSAVPARTLAGLPDLEEATHHLRQRSALLGMRDQAAMPWPLAKKWRLPGRKAGKIPAAEPVADAVAPEALRREVGELAPERVLLEAGGFQVLFAPAHELPKVLREIGRLRELTFRAVGEGTGRALDTDEFDRAYWHLVLWNRDEAEIAGAYRACRMDETLRQSGLRGLYTHTLFDYGTETVGRLGPAFELGRSFVRAEYQREYMPLMLMWKGLGQLLLREPRYKVFLGAVSISREYPPAAQRLIVEFLKRRHPATGLMEGVRPRHPTRFPACKTLDVPDLASRISGIDELSALIADMDHRLGGVPILLRQYVKLGGRLLAWSVDPAFGSVLDVLVTVDLARTEPRVMERFMGKEEARRFMEFHGIPADSGSQRAAERAEPGVRQIA